MLDRDILPDRTHFYDDRWNRAYAYRHPGKFVYQLPLSLLIEPR